jgi:NAD(P)-dependent dehydrogenase (short-subunit alcohol dehydrogenase family)
VNAGTKRIAAITGGAQGLGRAIAERLGRSGISVVLGDLDLGLAKKTAEEMKAAGIEAAALPLDVVDEKSVAAFYRAIDERFQRLDILVNNAGVLGLDQGKRPLVENMSLELWRHTIDVNLTGVFLASRGAIPLMKRGKWGRIVSLSSRAGRMKTGLGNSNYGASKAGVIGFSRVMAGELGRDGITVNCVAPSRIPTAMTLASPTSKEAFDRNIAETAVGRLATPQDVANTVNFLCSDEAEFLTGVVVDVTGGSYMT